MKLGALLKNNMAYKVFLIIIFVFIFLIAGLFTLFINQPVKKWGRVCFNPPAGGNCFNVELVKTPLEISKGLMFRKNLEQDKGMLFIFAKEAKYSFWMKNTLIPLDIIWIDGNNKVVFLSEETQPCKWHSCSSIKPTAEAKYVLEVNSGIVKKMAIKIGDEAILDIK